MRTVWESKLDGKYDIAVTSEQDAYSGTLTIKLNGELLHEEPVPIAYGAPFGPDAMDVDTWQEIGCHFVDSLPKEEQQ